MNKITERISNQLMYLCNEDDEEKAWKSCDAHAKIIYNHEIKPLVEELIRLQSVVGKVDFELIEETLEKVK